jgi:putative oxidoreductase
MMQSKPNPALLAARVLIALLFVIAGVRKVLYYSGTLAYFNQIGIPMADVVLPLTILLELGGGLAVILGWRLQLVAPVMAIFTVGAGCFAHNFWAADASQYAAQLNNFLKNLAIAGAFIALATEARARLSKA